MDKSQAIRSLAEELESKDTDIYCFQPKGGAENFIAETVITGAAVVLLTAFLKGLESTLKPELDKLGATLGTWISDRLESLFKAQPANDAELDRIAGTVRSLVAQASPKQREQVAAKVEDFLQDVLVQHGVSKNDAGAIAASTRRSAMKLAK
jgi:hypothetical protein